jgi:hypothetical protein
MTLRTTAIAACLVVVPAVADAAGAPVAIVEDVSATGAGVEVFDYLDAGRTLDLGADGLLVLGYLGSCVREEIRGGRVTVGTARSTVAGGTVAREKSECDGGRVALSSAQAGKSGAMAFRRAPAARGAVALPEAERTLFGASPLIEVTAAGTLVIERLDAAGERLEAALAPGMLARGTFHDLARADVALAPGGLYRATFGDRSVVFRVDPFAKPGRTPMVGRLLRFR